MNATTTHVTTATIEADPEVPVLRITRDFRATPEQLFRAHTAPDLYARWIGPKDLSTRIDHWEPRTGGSWRFTNIRGEGADTEEFRFHGCFHEVRADRIVQTFTWEGYPDGVSLDTVTFEDLGDGWSRLVVSSLVDSFEAREQMLASGMDVGINDGYATLDTMLDAGEVT